MDYMQLLSSLGRNGDTMLAHINPKEAELLKALGGAGTTNPETGLPEFYDAAGMGGAPGAGGDVGGSGLSGAAAGAGLATDAHGAISENAGIAPAPGLFDFVSNALDGPNSFHGYGATVAAAMGAPNSFGFETLDDLGITPGKVADSALSVATGGLSGLLGLGMKGVGIVGNLVGAEPAGKSDMYPDGNPAYGPGGPLSSMQAGGANLAAGMGGTDYNGLPASIPSANTSIAATAPSAATTTPTSTKNLASSLGIDANILDMLLRSGVSQV